jgi:hypothetical protein
MQLATDLLYLVFFIIALALVFLSVWLTPKLGINELRRVAAVDAIDEIVNSCAERGRPMLASPTTYILGYFVHVIMITSAMHIMKRIATLCGKLNVPMHMVASSPQVTLMMQDFAQQGFIESGHAERWNPDLVYFTGGWMSVQYAFLSVMEEFNTGGVLHIGQIVWNTHVPIIVKGWELGAISMMGCIYPEDVAFAMIGCDYATVTEESVAAAAYLTKDPVNTASIIGSDYVKFLMMIFMIIFAVITATGGAIP